MKKTSISAVLATVIIYSGSATAASNEIQFLGEVSTQTCSVEVLGNQQSLVLLPTVPASALPTAGATTGDEGFSLKLSGCAAPTVTAENYKIRFVSSNFTTNGNLENINGTATGVSLQLTEESGTAINLANGEGLTNDLTIDVGSTEAISNYNVKYYAETASVTAGSVMSSVQYAVSYM